VDLPVKNKFTVVEKNKIIVNIKMDFQDVDWGYGIDRAG
jgi:hypothetical protein